MKTEVEYLSEDKEIRQNHLRLNEKCFERGGISTNHRGVLAQYLNTPIYGKPAYLCHACNNPKCSNPNHLYWGTASENIQDAKDNGVTYRGGWDNLCDKHGEEKAKKILAERFSSLGWSKGGKASKGKPKSEEHKRKLSESQKGKCRPRRPKAESSVLKAD